MRDTDSGCDTCATWGHAQAVECAVVSTFPRHGKRPKRGNIGDWLRGDAWGKQEFGAGFIRSCFGACMAFWGVPYTKGLQDPVQWPWRWQKGLPFGTVATVWGVLPSRRRLGAQSTIDEFEGTKRTRAKGRIFPSEPWSNSAVIICVPWLFHLEHGQLLFCEKSTHPRHPKAGNWGDMAGLQKHTRFVEPSPGFVLILLYDAVCRYFFYFFFKYIYGCFLKWWYPQNTPKWSFFSRKKPMVVGYHHLRKTPMYIYIYTNIGACLNLALLTLHNLLLQCFLAGSQSIFDVLNVILNIKLLFEGTILTWICFGRCLIFSTPLRIPGASVFFFRSLGNTAIESYAKDGRLEPPKTLFDQKHVLDSKGPWDSSPWKKLCWEYVFASLSL